MKRTPRPTRLPRPLRLLAVVAALLAVSLSATACDTSPYAAQVNSEVIKQAALNSELAAWASNPAYVTDFNQSNSGASGGTPITVAGDAPGTFSTAWVADILGDMIVSSVVHQHLQQTGRLPSAEITAAARSLYQSVPYWAQFSPAFRDTLTQRLADEAAFLPAPTGPPSSAISQAYQQNKQYFYNQVCVRLASAFSQADAQAITSSGTVGGAPVCYTPVQLEDYPAAFRNALTTLAVGAVSQPLQTSYGYQVVQIVSRQEQGLNEGVQRVLSLVGSPAPDSLSTLLHQARIRVDPLYGSWNSSQLQVSPPSAPSLPS